MKGLRSIGVLLLLLAGLCVVALCIRSVQNRMNVMRREYKLTETEPLENAPPVVAFTTVALGGFRGLLADLLWLRLNRLQEQGSYFEMVQLASWIVKLQPRFTGAAAFLAWNMAYNVSVSFTSYEDRWRWVRKGIELLRDEALRYNPGAPELYKELAWIYAHKMAQYSDDANRYYKLQLAREMIRVFGEYPPDWDALGAAPGTVEGLKNAIGEDCEFWELLRKHGWSFDDFEEEFRRLGKFPPEIAQAAAKAPWGRTVELCLRKRWLKKVYKLDSAHMQRLVQTYGPLDWRLPEAHAVYWASLGLESAERNVNIQCERVIFQSLNLAFKTGRLIYLKDIDYLEMAPNLALVDAVDRQYRKSMARHPDNTSVRAAYENFLVDAVVLLYQFGLREKAKEYLDKARKEFGSQTKRYRKSLDEFALDELTKDLKAASYHQAQDAVQGYLLNAYYALALGEYDRANAMEDIAARIWKKYMRFIAGTEKRRRLPPYPQMKRNAAKRCLKLFPPQLAARLLAELEQNGSKIGVDKQTVQDLRRRLTAQKNKTSPVTAPEPTP